MSSDIDKCQVNDTVKLPQFSPYILWFFLHQKMPILPCTEYNPLFDRFFGTVWVTWSMTQRRSNWARNSSLGCCVSTSLLDAFSLSMWPKSEKERKSAIYIAKDSSLEKLMAVLWSQYCVLDARNLWGCVLHREAPISRSYPFWQLTSILGNSCRDGHRESRKSTEILGKSTHV